MKQGSKLKYQKLFLGVEKGKAISKVKNLIQKLKERNEDSRNRWEYYIWENKDIASDLEKIAKTYQEFLDTVKND